MSVNSISSTYFTEQPSVDTSSVSASSTAQAAEAPQVSENNSTENIEYTTVSTETTSQSSKNTAQIKLAVSQNSSSMSAQQVSEKYGITLSEAQKILDELAEDSQSGNSTFSVAV